MMIFIILVFALGALSVMYVLFPPASCAKALEIVKHIYFTKKIKKKYKKEF